MNFFINSIADFNKVLPQIRTQTKSADMNWAINYRQSLVLTFELGFKVEYKDGYFFNYKHWPLMDEI